MGKDPKERFCFVSLFKHVISRQAFGKDTKNPNTYK